MSQEKQSLIEGTKLYEPSMLILLRRHEFVDIKSAFELQSYLAVFEANVSWLLEPHDV